MTHPGGQDPQGNPRTIPVKLGGLHAGVVVWMSRVEYERMWFGVDREAAKALGRPA